MNKLIFLLIIFNSIVFAQSDEEKFLQANNFYKNNEFQQAVDLYQKINDKNSHVWFNIGNSYYKLGKIADAKVAYLKAKKIARLFDLENIDYNLNQLNQKVNITDDASSLEKIFNIISKYMSLVSFFILQILFLLIWFVTNFFLINLIKSKKYILFLVLIFVNVTFLAFLTIKYIEMNRSTAIVAVDDLGLLAGPDKNYHQIGSLKACDKINVLKKSDGWLKISKSNLIGWVPSKIGEEKKSDSVLLV